MLSMEVVHDEPEIKREAEDDVPDRRATEWLKPPFILQIVLFVGAIVSFYMLSERRTTTLEIAAANLNEKATRIEGQMASIVASVQSATNAQIRQQTEIEQLKESNRELKGTVAELKAHIDVVRTGYAKLDARTENLK